MVKFPTKGEGVGSVQEDQYELRQCYATTLRDKNIHLETMPIFLNSRKN